MAGGGPGGFMPPSHRIAEKNKVIKRRLFDALILIRARCEEVEPFPVKRPINVK